MSNARNISKAESRFVNATGDTLSGGLDVFTSSHDFDWSDDNGYPRFTQASGSAQVGLFRRDTNVGGGYIGADGTKALRVFDPAFVPLVEVTQEGYVNRNKQPYFQVRKTDADQTLSADALITFNHIVHEVNGGFNTTTSTFTAPVAGRYLFTFTASARVVDSGAYNAVYILYNGAGTGYRFRTTNASGNWSGFNGSCILNMNANDTIKLNGYAASGTVVLNSNETHFCGYLLG